VNGKVDRRVLADIENTEGSRVEYAAPGNDIEEKLVKVWQEVLNIEKIGINDNFFILGGDSIKAIQISSRMHSYSVKVGVKNIFDYPTIRQLGTCTSALERIAHQGNVEGEVDLTPIQMWFFEQDFTDRHHWNQAVMLYSEKGFDEQAVRRAFGKITEHHDALRMVYRTDNGKVVQYNRDMKEELYTLEIFDFAEVERHKERIEKEANRIQGSIDLSRGPLVRLGLFRTPEGDHMLIVIHHLVVDGVSWRILLEDFEKAYTQAVNGDEIKLEDKTDSYKDWAKALKQYAGSKELLMEAEYWNRIDNTVIEMLPIDYEINENRQGDTNIASMDLAEEDTDRLLGQVNAAYNTKTIEILIAALVLSMREWAKVSMLAINMEGHGREEIISDLNVARTIGWFTSSYPVILDIAKSEDISYQIVNVKEGLSGVPNKGICYGILKYITSIENKKFSLKLKPQINFNYLGQFNQNTDEFILLNTRVGSIISLNSKRTHMLDINCIILNGRLNVSFAYNRLQFKEETMQRLVEAYKKNLTRIMIHCLDKKHTELTPSDLSSKGLTMDDIKDVIGILEGTDNM